MQRENNLFNGIIAEFGKIEGRGITYLLKSNLIRCNNNEKKINLC